VTQLPANARSITAGDRNYHYAGGVFYAAAAGGYCVTRPPIGCVVPRPLPGGCWRYWWGSRWYWYYGGVYWCDHYWYDDDDEDDDDDEPEEEPDPQEFEVVEPTVGATVPYLPEGASAMEVGGVHYFMYEDTWYKPTLVDGEVAYEIVPKPE
jgi:hypothetical protein